jgi:hypothetical protein
VPSQTWHSGQTLDHTWLTLLGRKVINSVGASVTARNVNDIKIKSIFEAEILFHFNINKKQFVLH